MRITPVARVGLLSIACALALATAWLVASGEREVEREAVDILHPPGSSRYAGSVRGAAGSAPEAEADVVVVPRLLEPMERAPEPLVADAPPVAGPAPDTPGRVRARLVARDGSSVPDIDLTITAEADLFVPGPPSPYSPYETPADAARRRTLRKGLMLATFEGMRPGVPFTVTADDRFGRELAVVEQSPLAPAESRLVELRIERALVNLHVRILDRDGRGIDDADVKLVQGESGPARSGSHRGARTRFDGLADLGWCEPAPYRLDITRSGRSISWQSERAASSDGGPVLVHIDRGRP